MNYEKRIALYAANKWIWFFDRSSVLGGRLVARSGPQKLFPFNQKVSEGRRLAA